MRAAREVLEEAFGLQQQRQRALFGRQRQQVDVVQVSVPDSGQQEAGQEVEQRGFAGAAGAGNGGDFAGQRLHGKDIGLGLAGIGEGQVFSAQHERAFRKAGEER